MKLRFVLCFVFAIAFTCVSDAADKPNVLFIAVDDLNDWIGGLGGNKQSATPNIDRLTSRGMLFANAHCAAPACNPSRAALMTGIRPSTSGVYLNSQSWRDAMPTAVTLPQHFMANGYTAMGSGKIYHGRWPDPPSWDVYFPSKKQQKPADPLPLGRPLNGIPKTAHFDWGPVDVDDAKMGDAQVADWVIGQLNKKHNKPFFLACGFYRPHLPWYAPKKYFDMFPLDSIELPKTIDGDLDDVPAAGRKMARPEKDHANVTKHKQWKQAVQGYLASIAFTDAQLGRVMAAFDKSPHAKNTIIVFWTDHGWHLGEKQHWRKFALWEEATRTPLAMVVPGLTKAGQRCDRPVNLLDIYPTLVELCGLSQNKSLEGISVRRLLEDPKREWERPSLTTHGRNNHAVRSDRYRFIRYADGSEELYDHQTDPMEWKNLTSDKKLALVKAQLAMYLPLTNVVDAEDQPVVKDPKAGTGIMVGDVGSTRAFVQVRLSKTDKLVEREVPGMEGFVEFILSAAGSNDAVGKVVQATSNNDFIARTEFDDLKPGTLYVCKTRIGKTESSLKQGPIARFKTHPGKSSADTARMVVVTGMNYAKFHGDSRIDREIHLLHNNTVLPEPYDGPDKNLGYPGLASILKTKPHYFVGTGDNVYYDTPKKPRAETITEMRQKWHEQFVQPRYRDLFAAVGTYWMVDDHDYRIDDGDNTGDHDPSPAVGRQMMLEQLPVAAHGDDDAKTYRTYRVNRDLQVWFPENRMYRSPNEMKDGPGKSIWGKEQKAWLKRTLKASDAKYKLLVSPTPMIGPDDARKIDNHCDINGFQHERDEFFDWLKETGIDKDFAVVCGDRHWQYHAEHPSGIQEFSCGALVDANSRLGRKPGDPESSDPKGEIKQHYSQKERSGGFLLIEASAPGDKPQLKFIWHDEFGKVLHEHRR